MMVRRAGAVLMAGALAGTVLAACGSSPADKVGQGGTSIDDCAGDRPGPAAVVGMAATDGGEQWTRTFGAMTNSMDVGGVLVLSNIEGEAIGVDPATGAALWCRPGTGSFDNTADPAGTIAAPAGTTLLTLGPEDRLVAFDGRTGQDLWSVQAPPSVLAFPDIRGDRVLLVERVVQATYAGQPPDETMPVIATYDIATGARVEGPAEVLTMEQSYPTTTAGDVLVRQVIGPEPYQITVIVSDATTGAERWRLTRHGVSAGVEGDVVVVLDQTGGTTDPTTVSDTLIGYSVVDGTELWSVRMGAASSFVMTGGDLVLWSGGSELTAVDRATGAVRWEVDHGSPGVGGAETEPGHYTTFVPSPDGSVLAGVIVAEQPYRD